MTRFIRRLCRRGRARQEVAGRLIRSDRGQGTTEYIIIVALIAIAAIGVVTIFGESVRELFSASTSALAGDTNVKPSAREAPRGQYVRNKTLKTFGKGNK